jgi:hypothetical protein
MADKGYLMRTQTPLASGAWISLTPYLSAMLFLAVFAGFQGGRYFFANRLQELGTFCALLVFVIGAWVTLFRISQAEWKRWVYTPCLLIGAIMMIWSATFGLKFGESLIFSLFASREFLLGFIGPAMYLIVRAGYPLASLVRVIWMCLLALLVNYIYFYSTMDLRAAFFSSDHTLSALITYDEWRGFRLKPTMFAVMLALLSGTMLLWQRRSVLASLFAIALISLACYIWSIVLFRAHLATMILSLVIYLVFLIHPRRINYLLLLAPLGVIATPYVVVQVFSHFQEADGGALRIGSYKMALSQIVNHPLLGVGEDSAYGRTYQDLFSSTFFPSDLGLIGVMFKYGTVGTTLYLYCHFLTWGRLWRTNFLLRCHNGRHDPLLWGMLILMTSQTLNLPLISGLVHAQGITLASVAIAYCALQTAATKPQTRPGAGPEAARSPHFTSPHLTSPVKF